MSNFQGKGVLITLEGIEGCGKSMLIKNLQPKLQDAGLDIIITREPGDTKVGHGIRKILFESKLENFDIDPLTEFLLFSADRAQHIRQLVKPALNKNKIIISDRMADSSMVYQGFCRGLNLDTIDKITTLVMNNTKPDLILYLKIDFQVALERLTARKDLNRFDKESELFYKKSIYGYETIFKDNPNVITIDASESKEAVLKKSFEAILKFLKSVNYEQSSSTIMDRRNESSYS